MHDSAAQLLRLLPIPAFVVGVGVGVATVELVGRRGRIPPLALLTTVEIVFLVIFMVVGRTSVDAVVMLPAFALGLQTAALRRIDGRTVRTTFITGMLTRFAEDSVTFIFDQLDARRGRAPSVRVHYADARRVIFMAGIWCSYFTGAVVGAFLVDRWHLWSLWVPIAILSGVAASDALALRTIAAREERREGQVPAQVPVPPES